MLIISAIWVGLYSGIAIAVITPIFAFMLGGGVLRIVPQIVPVLMIGNALIVVFVYILRNKSLIAGMVLGSLAKFGFLWAGVSFLIIPFFGGVLSPMQVTMVAATFSYNQLITATIGSIIAFLILPRLEKLRIFPNSDNT
jgi:hypothetical protein